MERKKVDVEKLIKWFEERYRLFGKKESEMLYDLYDLRYILRSFNNQTGKVSYKDREI